MIENAVEPERNPENEKKLIEMQTFLLAYLTAKVSLPVYLMYTAVPALLVYSDVFK